MSSSGRTSTAPWLSRQRKTDLSELADVAGMTNYKSLKKPDLEEELDKHLRTNITTLSANLKFAEYYRYLKEGSPGPLVAKDLVFKSETKTPSKPRKRPTAAKEDATDSEANAGASNPRTPARSLVVASRVPLPPSPAVIAENAEKQLASASKWVKQRYAKTGIQSHVEAARDRASTSYSVTSLAISVEALVLLSALLPLKSLGVHVPAVAAVHFSGYDVQAPNFWLLLELQYWATSFLWAGISILVPAASAYFFNLTLKAKKHGSRSLTHRFDPFTFNLTKLLLVWLVFVQRVALPTAPLQAARLFITTAVPGGYLWILVSGGVGALISLYEAILKQ